MSGFLLGIATAFGARALFARAVLRSFDRDVAALNAGDYHPLLKKYADDALLVFNDGDHRWAGEHRGKAAIERFLQDFVAAGVQGEVRQAWFAGPPWAMKVAARFDDGAVAADGEQLYRNRLVLVLEMRWAKVVRQDDFYEDTSRIERLEAGLRERGVAPVS